MNGNHEDETQAYLQSRRAMIDEALQRYMPDEENYPQDIFKSVRYSLFAGGKRLRPILCLAAAEAVGGSIQNVLPVACALELIHSYSLIHDDLPAMDDDDYRRGMPTNHKVFGENIAILAGDALLTEAFHLMSSRNLQKSVEPDRLLDVIHEISEAAGFFGMVGGQVVDVQSERMSPNADILQYIHTRKTGRMILAAVRAGAMIVGASRGEVEALSEYGRHIGLAFQIADDILNVEGYREQLGKETGTDASRGKMTFPALFGVAASRQKARELVELALTGIAGFDYRAEPLRMIARHIIERNA